MYAFCQRVWWLPIAIVITTTTASAATTSEPKNRVRDFLLESADRVDAQPDPTSRTHRENHPELRQLASGCALAAKGGARLLDPARTFAAGKLDKHFTKHAGEWGAGNITKEAYLKRAQDLLSREPGGNILGATRPGGDILRYNVRTNELAVGTAEGTIRTLFRPQEGMAYWLGQVP